MQVLIIPRYYFDTDIRRSTNTTPAGRRHCGSLNYGSVVRTGITVMHVTALTLILSDVAELSG